MKSSVYLGRKCSLCRLRTASFELKWARRRSSLIRTGMLSCPSHAPPRARQRYHELAVTAQGFQATVLEDSYKHNSWAEWGKALARGGSLQAPGLESLR